MKRIIFLLTLLAVASWWLLVGGRQISETHVRAFYEDYERATLARQPEAMCALLDERFSASGKVTIHGRETSQTTQSKAETCESFKELYQTWAELGEKMGGLLQLDSTYTIHSIKISPDGHSATVEISTALDVGGTLMQIRSHSTDTLVRRNGLVRMLRSDGHGAIGPAP
ncbi:MAG TPA: nuclear transport factor 2 family protein [Aquabacterium sp.]|uniref:nuclear transport factor 2 family protein n=1 Tax=Aquabacterium sp. TaxID=1872578 RepID=UPI002E328835|nr:nuclear transport factor 2 family protein [Aquabacterium sp.]HEX5358001.1 nuclear transport factor 2 family protein [Aquabacterium sp.]